MSRLYPILLMVFALWSASGSMYGQEASTVPLKNKAESQSHWPRFRGPHADGVAADDPRLPDA